MKRIAFFLNYFLFSLVLHAQISIQPITNWKQNFNNGHYIFTPVTVYKNEISYEVMPLVKSIDINLDEWLDESATKDLQGLGYSVSTAQFIQKKDIYSFKTYSTSVKDANGKNWFINFLAYQKPDASIRYAKITMPSGTKGTYLNDAIKHFFALSKKEGFERSSTIDNSLTDNEEKNKTASKKETNVTPVTTVKQGIKLRDIKGVVLNMESGYGPGGVALTYNPYILLNDGSIYKHPTVCPYELDIAKSKQIEPDKWGSWKLDGKNIVVKFSNKGKIETERWDGNWFWAKPAMLNEKIKGSFTSTSGGGNTAVGGTFLLVISDNIIFNDKGQFTFKNTTGSTSSDAGVDVTNYSSKDAAGTYKLDGYSVELQFNNGKVTRKLFYFYPDSHRTFAVGEKVYLPASD